MKLGMSRSSKPCTCSRKKNSRNKLDFSNVGGLSHHIKTLKELIIFPLLYGNLYSHFNIKAPRGVLFYGPPGTGKTLVAAALANEINTENIGKVSFFHRKGADCLDKWLGESEKKLKDLFDKAAKARPSIIFFDEIDGLAPIRSQKNDHVHCSVVSTLLALMDGLDNMNGVVVIGATNRLDALDPALRRPGRFDKELYFPMPSTEARKEIIQVHTKTWKHPPTEEFINNLANITAGCCGADLQALCAEAVLCCTKRLYPTIGNTGGTLRVRIDPKKMKVEECDFMNARLNVIPSSQKIGTKMRQLCPILRPLLERQIDNIVSHVGAIWPHFLNPHYKYVLGSNRYAGRIILIGSNKQGLSTHIIPGILQILEHLPCYVLDISTFGEEQFLNVRKDLPSLLVLSRVDEWWNHIEESDQISIAATLEDVHAGVPILTIASCRGELPLKLHDFFYNNCSVTLRIEDPSERERGKFFSPIFFDENRLSLYKVLLNTNNLQSIKNSLQNQIIPKSVCREIRAIRNPNLYSNGWCYRLRSGGKSSNKLKSHGNNEMLGDIKREKSDLVEKCSRKSMVRSDDFNIFSHLNSNMVNNCIQSSVCYKIIKTEPTDEQHKSFSREKIFKDSADEDKKKIYNLWDRISVNTSRNMKLTHLEILYDAIVLCLSMNRNNFQNLIESVQETLCRIENAQQCVN
ncbi:ATPase family AAA domain-containing protein 2-like [Coccinella septempunctata]|uniref:ATPase family AAA domain-containing protein 2-like n=1 Tax=Coccinella septempunctata TaxID=41139 RepID=UPI001D08DB09|nr:ATPase family AAA domain-containing protein 2-like [Coccinella septempunctata]XP_044747036.1 ATPase family AAA domain-containing protein 2-like [Coccinella septempunctata]